MSNYKNQLRAELKNKELSAGKVLSIGTQEDDKNYFAKVEVDEWVTLDFDNNFRPNIYYNLNLPILDQDGDLQLDQSILDSFDMVLAFNLWEYIYDPVTAHTNIRMLLKSGGILWTNYPFVYPAHEPRGMDYLRYTPEGAHKLLHDAGFDIIGQSAIVGNQKLLEFYKEDGMKARKDANHLLTGVIIKARKI